MKYFTAFIVLLLHGSCYGVPLLNTTEDTAEDSAGSGAVPRCENIGTFPVLESCQEYYSCSVGDDFGMKIQFFACLQGTIFDTQTGSCKSPSEVFTRPECMNGRFNYSNSMDDNHNENYNDDDIDISLSEQNASLRDIDRVSRSSKKACIFINHVDKYVNLVRSTGPINVPEYLAQTLYANILSDYNTCLVNARNHTFVWNTGDDILSGIKQTYRLAKNFGPTFKRMYQKMQVRFSELANISTVPDAIMTIEEDIEFLQMDIETNFDLLLNFDLKESIFRSIEEKILDQDARLTEYRERLRAYDQSLRRNLKDFVSIMESIRHNAIRIKTISRSTKEKLQTLRSHILQDNSAFNASKVRASEGLMILEENRRNTTTRLEEYKTAKNLLKMELDKKEDEADRKQEEMTQELEQLSNFLRENNLRIASADEAYTAQGWMLYIPLLGWVIGKGTRTEIQFHTQERATRVRAISVINEAEISKLTILRERIKQNLQKIAFYDDSQDMMEEELHKLTFVDFFLDEVVEDGKMILPYIQEAMVSLAKLVNIFNDMVDRIDELIDQAENVKGRAEQQDIQALMFINLNLILDNWNTSYDHIVNLGRCTVDGFLDVLDHQSATITANEDFSINNTSVV